MRASAPVNGLKEYLDRWGNERMSCEPADRAGTEAGICLAYSAAGLAPPERIVWCGGPMAIAKHLATASPDDQIGPNVKTEVFDQVRDRVDTLTEIFWKEVMIAALELGSQNVMTAVTSGHSRSIGVGKAVNRAVLKALDAYLSRLSVRARHCVLRLRGLPRLLPKSSFQGVALGPDQLSPLGVHEYLHDAPPWQGRTHPMQGIWKIAKSAGWMVPHERVCWVSERPGVLRADAANRLHCADGPALQYRDGWSLYAWKGIEVPAWMIEHPELITVGTIGDTIDPVLRNCMIEIMTPERFIRSGGARRIAEDDAGTLWRARWSYRGVTTDSWAAVEVVNGTAESDGSRRCFFLRVPPRMGTAREAVAWTYGLSPKHYAKLDART